jgi:plastocyanin
MRSTATMLLALVLLPLVAGRVAGQSTLERPATGPELWTGVPWALELYVAPLFGRAGDQGSGLHADPAVRAALALTGPVVLEARYAPQPIELHGADEIEAALRATPLLQDSGHWLDLGLEGRVATGSDVAALTAAGARWLGPLRLGAHAGALFPTGDADATTRMRAGASALWHPAPGRLPLALAGEVATLLDPEPGERVAWTAGLQLGVSFTPHTLALFATNGGTSLAGRSTGTDHVRVGLELTTHVPVGRFFGRYAPREISRESVRPDDDAAPVVVVSIRDYRYAPARIEIEAGSAVEWINEDQAVHTASSDNGTWDSGAIPQGQRWRAVFHEPGLYPYHCGPHPFMRGVVVVRPRTS